MSSHDEPCSCLARLRVVAEPRTDPDGTTRPLSVAALAALVPSMLLPLIEAHHVARGVGARSYKSAKESCPVSFA
jgi:hypothetical protein